MWAWLTDYPAREHDEALRDGWCGVYGLPRVLWLGNDDRTLHLAPAPELERLRYHPREFDDLTLDDGGAALLSGINGESCEIGLRIEPGTAQQVGLQVRTSPDGAETHPPLLRRGGAEPGVRRYPQRQQGPPGGGAGAARPVRRRGPGTARVHRPVGRRSVRQRPPGDYPARVPRGRGQRPGNAVVPRWPRPPSAPYAPGR